MPPDRMDIEKIAIASNHLKVPEDVEAPLSNCPFWRIVEKADEW
jgi:hypothetical protein